MNLMTSQLATWSQLLHKARVVKLLLQSSLHRSRPCQSSLAYCSPGVCQNDSKEGSRAYCSNAIYRTERTVLTKASTVDLKVYETSCKYMQYKHGIIFEGSSEGLHKEWNKAPKSQAEFIGRVVPILRRMQLIVSELAELQVLSEENADPELAKDIESDRLEAELQYHELNEELKENICPVGTADKDNVILEVTRGVGGEEAALFCKDLASMYRRYAAYRGWMWTEESGLETEKGGSRKFVGLIEGVNVFRELKYEGGIHRVQRVPTTEKSGRPHTSTAAVTVLPKPDKVQIDLPEKDLEFQFTLSSGPGGQHVQKTETSCRVVHKPTGLATTCQETRSALQNKTRAVEKLKRILYRIEVTKQLEEESKSRQLQVTNTDRSSKIRTYNFLADRVVDHRIGYTVHDATGVFHGEEVLDGIVQALQKVAAEELLKETLEQMSAEIDHMS